MSARSLGPLLVAAAILIAACGVPTDAEPSAIPDVNLPPGLSSTTTTVIIDDPRGIDVEVFLLGEDDRLQSVLRTVSRPTQAGEVLETLIATADDEAVQDEQLRSLIPPSTVIGGLEIADGVLTIDFGPEGFAELEGDQQFQALGQIVFTMTALGTVDSILLRIEGGDLRTLPTDGDPSEEPVNRDDYRSLS